MPSDRKVFLAARVAFTVRRHERGACLITLGPLSGRSEIKR